MSLRELLGEGPADVRITGLAFDHRLVEPGFLFFCVPGFARDGHDFAPDAVARGAAALVVSRPLALGVPEVRVPDVRAAMATAAARFHGDPTARLRVVGITGTNGKTTTAYLLRHLLGKFKLRCGLVGTVEVDDGRSVREANMTTPGACEIAGLLASMRDKGCRAAAVEVSSHALDQGRVAGVPFAGAAFTNLTGDHLDYHENMDNYAAAKARLFESLGPTTVAVVNDADEYTPRVIRDCHARVLRFGFGKTADYRARDASYSADGTRFTLQTPDGKAEIAMPLVGKHNVENVLAAAALVGEVFHLTAQQIAAGLADAQGAPGRLQAVRALPNQPFTALVVTGVRAA